MLMKGVYMALLCYVGRYW